MADSIIVGKATIRDGMKVKCEADKHSFYLDEPVSSGGTDEGMNPIEALLSSLGACKSIITQMAAKKMGIKFDELEVECKGSIDFDGVTGKNPNAKIGLKNIETTYKFRTSESQEKINKLVDYVDVHCPVMDTIVNSPCHSYKAIIK